MWQDSIVKDAKTLDAWVVTKNIKLVIRPETLIYYANALKLRLDTKMKWGKEGQNPKIDNMEYSLK